MPLYNQQVMGHQVWTNDCGSWYADGTRFSDDRSCAHCGLNKDSASPDPCIGFLPGVEAACCSHGVSGEGYVLDDNGNLMPLTEWYILHIDTEQWKIYPYSSKYQVSTHGRIRHIRKNSIVMGSPTSVGGYLQVQLADNSNGWLYKKKHQVVLETFVGPKPPKMEVRHLDGNPSNNRLDNLEWSDHPTNCMDKIKHGTVVRGERHEHSKLTEPNILEIYSLLDAHQSKASIARQYGVDASTISRINTGKKWSYMFKLRGVA